MEPNLFHHQIASNADFARDPGHLVRFAFTIGSYEGDGSVGPLGEFAITFMKLPGGVWPKLECYQDGLLALTVALAQGLGTRLDACATPDEFAGRLIDIGIPKLVRP